MNMETDSSKIYTVYKTTNLKNGKYYIGTHGTKNPNDNYLGSGTYFLRSIKKYGSENFKKEILFEFNTQEEAWKKEYELTQIYLKNPLCMNITSGGRGGFDYLNNKGWNNKNNNHKKATRIRMSLYKTNPEFVKRHREKINEGLIRHRDNNIEFWKSHGEKFKIYLPKAQQVWTGQKHTPEACKKMSEKAKQNNTFSGRKWMTKDLLNKPVKAEEIEKHLTEGWVFGRKGNI
jgi:hypothetical protein